MTKLDLSRSILNFNGGILGRAFIAQAGFIDAFVVNSKFSVLVSKDHASVKAMDSEKVTEDICRQIASLVLKYKDFTIEKDGSCWYIYDKTEA